MSQLSIRTKVTMVTVLAIFVSFLAIGGISIASIRETGNRNSAEMMNLLCENQRETINKYLFSIEQSVDMAGVYATEDIGSVELMSGGVVGYTGLGDSVTPRTDGQRALLDRYLRAHSQRVETLFRSVANHTNGVLTYYYRFNPELSNDVLGFWFSKGEDEAFLSQTPTPIPDYSPDDISRVGWYYLPLMQGEASWLEPYYNENLGELMVSYVAPIYKANTFIGVLGMDISYDTLVGQLENIRVYETGYALLATSDGTIVYHPTLPMGTNLSDVDPAFAELSNLMQDRDSSTAPLRYGKSGEEMMLVFTTLSNGMKLAVVAPVREINASWTNLMNLISLTTLILMALFTTFSMLIFKRVTEPLQRLTAASKLLAEGDYNITLDYAGEDEVGVLTTAFQQLVNHLRDYISDLNSRAYQDAMTGVKNKGAYTAAIWKLNECIRTEQGQAPEFGIVMLDCNNLKQINDNFGHEHGDQYLVTSCELICQVFTHSPVFRVGGDEFVVILQKDDYVNRDELLRNFDRLSEEINAKAEAPWEEVSVAKGLAVFDPKTDVSAEKVMERADELMYTEKARMKAARHK